MLLKDHSFKVRFNHKVLLDGDQLEELDAIINNLPNEFPQKHLYKNRRVYEYEISGDYGIYIIRLNYHWHVITVFNVLPFPLDSSL